MLSKITSHTTCTIQRETTILHTQKNEISKRQKSFEYELPQFITVLIPHTEKRDNIQSQKRIQ